MHVFLLKRISPLLLVFTLMLLVSFVQLENNSLLFQEIQNAGHIPIFILLTLALFYFVRTGADSTNVLLQYRNVLIMGMCLAVVTEYLQLLTGRFPDLHDMLRDFVGILMAVVMVSVFDAAFSDAWKQKYPSMVLVYVLVLLLFFFSLSPLLKMAVSSYQRDRAMPLLLDLEAQWASSFVNYKNTVHKGSSPLQQEAGLSEIHFLPARYPGVEFIEPVADWSGYEKLALDVDSRLPEPVKLILRIHDQQHNQYFDDRFTVGLVVKPGSNHYAIALSEVRQAPAARDMDMKKITGVVIHMANVREAMTLHIGKLRLQ